MKPLPLDPQGYPGSYKLVGGRPSLDLVNTVSWPGTPREHDWLATTANVSSWLAATGVPASAAAPVDVARVRRILTHVLRPIAHGAAPKAAALEQFNRLLGATLARRRIDPDDLSWGWEPPRNAADALAPVVLDAAEIITGDHGRLRHCPSCDWIFEDQTRNGRRRWCDMADCGSRAKAAAYYYRNRRSSATAAERAGRSRRTSDGEAGQE